MASDDLKHLVAREIASGETIADVARRHGYTWKGMKKLVETAEVQALINAERQSIGELGERCRARLFQLAPEALDNIAEMLRNRKHPKRLETSRFVVEKILPARAMLQAEVHVEGSVRPLHQAHMPSTGLTCGPPPPCDGPSRSCLPRLRKQTPREVTPSRGRTAPRRR